MISDTDPKLPQIEHLFIRGLRFEEMLQYLTEGSGKRKARLREIGAPKAGLDGRQAWCSAGIAGILETWPLKGHAQSHDGWKSMDADTIDQLIQQG